MIGGKVYCLVVLVALIGWVVSAPALGDDETSTCYNQACPPRTTACKKITKTSDDKTTLDETIICLDNQDMELQRFTKKQPNPYGPGTHYESTSFTGTYSYTSGGNININHNNHIGNNNNKEVEDLS